MTNISPEAISELEGVIDQKIRNAMVVNQTSYEATVIDTDGDTVWVDIPGVSKYLPAEKSFVSPTTGDIVSVTFHKDKGIAVVDGNISNPGIGVYSILNGANLASGSVGNAAFKLGSISGTVLEDGTITGMKIAESTITGSLIADSTITGGKIIGSTLTDIPFAGIVDAQIEVARIVDATIQTAVIDMAQVNQLDVELENVRTLIAGKASIADLSAANARIDNIAANYASIDYIEANYITSATIETNYLRTDMMNANVGWIENGTIANAAITNEMVNSVSANKLTAGTIDASKINVANLRAENLVVTRINGQPVIGGYASVDKASAGYSSANPSAMGWYELTSSGFALSGDTQVNDSKVYYSKGTATRLYDQDYIDGLENGLNQRIDGAVETFTGSAIPNMSNYPVSGWTSSQYASHVGDIYYVTDPTSSSNGYCYRFAYDNTSSSYGWVLIKDSDVTKALSDISELQTFETNTTSWITQTDAGLTTIRQNHTALSGRVDNLEDGFETFESTTFKELVDEVDEQSSTITQMTEQIEKTQVSRMQEGSLGQRTIVTEDAADLPLLTLDPVYGESVQDGTPTPDAPVHIKSVSRINLCNNWDDFSINNRSHISYYVSVWSFTEENDPTYGRVIKCVCTKAGTGGPYISSYCFNWFGDCTSWTDFRDAYSGIPLTFSVYINVTSSTVLYTRIGIEQLNSRTTDAVESGVWKRVSVRSTVRTDAATPGALAVYRESSYEWAVGDIIKIAKPQLQVGSLTSYVDSGCIGIISSTGSISYLDLQGNELHGLDDTYRDILFIDANGHAVVEKRTERIVIDGTHADELVMASGESGCLNAFYFTQAKWISVLGARPPKYFFPAGNNKYRCDRLPLRASASYRTSTSPFITPWTDPSATFIMGFDSSVTTKAEAATWLNSNPVTIVFPLDDSVWYTIDLGYVDLPEVTDGATVYVAAEIQPVIGGSWWTKAGHDIGKTVSTTVNSVKQTADSNSAHLSNLTTLLGTNPDGTGTTTDIVSQYNRIDQDLNGLTTRVGKTEAKTSLRYTFTRDNWTEAQWAQKTVNSAFNVTPLNYSSTGVTTNPGFDGTSLVVGDLIMVQGTSTDSNNSNWHSLTCKVTTVPSTASADISTTIIAVDDTTALASRVTQAETSITQNSEAIALRATKSYVDSIETVNLIRNGDFEEDFSYWVTEGTTGKTIETDSKYGKVAKLTWSSAGGSYRIYPDISTNFTHEAGTYSVSFYAKADASNKIIVNRANAAPEYLNDNIDTTWRRYIATGVVSEGDTGSLTFRLNAAGTLYLAKVMLVHGEKPAEYNGSHKDYASQAELKVANDAINARVEKNGVISSINLSPESATINADRVNIAGAAIFSSTGALSPGKVIIGNQTQWYSSTSQSSLTGGSWVTTQPTLTEGHYLWQRNLITHADETTVYLPSETGVCISETVGVDTSNLALKTEAVGESVRIYYRTDVSNFNTKPTSWVTRTDVDNNLWTRKRMPYDSTYPLIYTCEQRKSVSGAFIGTTEVLLDDTTTVIDGGHITTGTIDSNRIAANSIAIGKLDTSTQNTISTASSNASTALSTANTASSNASTALSTANTASTKADNAAKTATNYITADTDGIKIHRSGDTTTYQHLISTGTAYYISGTKAAEMQINNVGTYQKGFYLYAGDSASTSGKAYIYGNNYNGTSGSNYASMYIRATNTASGSRTSSVRVSAAPSDGLVELKSSINGSESTNYASYTLRCQSTRPHMEQITKYSSYTSDLSSDSTFLRMDVTYSTTNYAGVIVRSTQSVLMAGSSESDFNVVGLMSNGRMKYGSGSNSGLNITWNTAYVGQQYSATSITNITTVGIDTPTNGASITVPAGTYVVWGSWVFNTGQTSGTRNTQIQIMNGSTEIASQRILAAAQNWNRQSICSVVQVTSSSTFTVRGSTSILPQTIPTTNTWIRAIYIGPPNA